MLIEFKNEDRESEQIGKLIDSGHPVLATMALMFKGVTRVLIASTPLLVPVAYYLLR